LRRVFDRFGESRDSYPGLYWSHFQAAVDWDDAEMWLEGAVQNNWSISEMRKTRWEATGAAAESKPQDSEIVAAELDEDAGVQLEVRSTAPFESEVAEVRGFDTDSDDDGEPADSHLAADADDSSVANERPAHQPFAELPSLPSDVTDAFESFKLCILRHRLAGWQEISQGDLLATLDALKELASAEANA
jgi:hypothetical protein